MGYGDELMAIGDAWQLHLRDPQRRRVAIGDGVGLHCACPALRDGLDFLASDADVAANPELPWVISHRGRRPYHDHAAMLKRYRRQYPLSSRLPGRSKLRKLVRRLGHYMYRMDYRPTPAPIVLSAAEQSVYEHWSKRRFVVIEPHIKDAASPCKQWPLPRYAELARRLRQQIEVYQIGAPDSPALDDLPRLPTNSFRDTFPLLKAAQFYIGSEGGLHHAAAAMRTRAIVLFGGYTPPEVTGYDFHICLTGDARYACGTQHTECPHCRAAMDAITVDDVLDHARRLLSA